MDHLERIDSSTLSNLTKVCKSIVDINKRNAHLYKQVKHLGRDAYLWNNIVIKSAPLKWNFLTKHEYNVHSYISQNCQKTFFPELFGKYCFNGRTFLFIEYIKALDMQKQFVHNFIGRFFITQQLIFDLLQKARVILEELKLLQIIHRDIQPANIIYSRDSKEMYLIDFGFSLLKNQMEIATDNYEQKELLEKAQLNLGGAYKDPRNCFDFKADEYSFIQSIQAIQVKSIWPGSRNYLKNLIHI